MAEVYVMANQKGGVGKTTTVFNLGVALTRLGQRVLLVDLDPQASLTVYSGFEPDDFEKTVYHCLLRDAPVERTAAGTPFGPDLLAANLDLSLAEFHLMNAIARERRAERMLEAVQDRYDFILLDSQPSLGLLTLNALAASDQVIIPVACEFLSIRGTAALLRLIAKVQGQLNQDLAIAGILPTLFDNRTNHGHRMLHDIQQEFPEIPLYPFPVNRSIRFPESAARREPIFDNANDIPGAEAYWRLAEALCGRVRT